ncbi:MAG: outer membrane beta-barrel protein [Candidatus Aminicenantaceae bacterium]
MRYIILTKKKGVIWIILFISLVFLSRITYSEEREKFWSKFSIKLTGGLRYMNVGDINNHLESFDNYMSSGILYYEGGKIEKINNYCLDLEGELRLDISSKFSIGVGIGYLHGQSKNEFQTVGFFPLRIPTPDFDMHVFNINPKVNAILLKLGIYYTFSLSSRLDLYLNSGLGYYFSKAYLLKNHTIVPLVPISPGPIYIYNEYEMSSNGFGFHGGVGFEFSISNALALVLEAQGRYVRIKNLKGTRVYNHTLFAITKIDEGILFVGERDMVAEGYGEDCPELMISQSKPTSDEFQNIREAVLDFSGFSLRVGIRIKLF